MGCVIGNDGSSQNGLVYATGASDLPGSDITVTFQVKFSQVDSDRYNTYVTHGPNTFSLSNNYWVIFKGITGIDEHVGIGSDGDDTYHASFIPSTGVWYKMMFRRRNTGGSNREQLFYPDLPNSTEISRTDTNGESLGSNNVLAIGYAPWIGGEGSEAEFRAVKMFTTILDTTQGNNEASYKNLYDSGLSSSLWGRWPLESNGNDLSGNARHFSNNGSVSFNDEAAPEYSPGQTDAPEKLRVVMPGMRWR